MIYTNLNNSGEVEAVYAAKRATIAGTPPLSYPSKGYDLEDFLISGNTVQNGTPTPEAPVDVVGCGARTKNLVNPFTRILTSNISPLGRVGVEYYDHGGYDLGYFQIIQGNTYTIDSYVYAFYYTIPDIGSTSYDHQRVVGTVGAPSSFIAPITGYCCFRVSSGDSFMANSGSTALPYEPYGYKLPISSVGQTTPVYLGEVETTRRIKKLVLTGEEAIQIKSGNAKWYIPISDMRTPTDPRVIEWCCSHYQAVGNYTSWVLYDYMISWSQLDAGTSIGLRIRDIDFLTATVTDFKSYLAAQYAAGTPVTIWYVLAEPETGIVNEPLHKIGDYADTISLSQSGITVPTTAGTNTITTETTVLPSSISVTTPEKEVEEIYAGINYQDPIYYKRRTLTGTSPLTFKALGLPLKDYLISGNTVQDGTPSPDYPVDVVGVGEMTENLFDNSNVGYYNNDNGQYVNDPSYRYWRIPVKSGDIISINNVSGCGYGCAYKNGAFVFGKITPQMFPYTVPDGVDEITNNFTVYYSTNAMVTVNQSIPDHYIPYGYKLPPTINGKEYPIYLGQVNTMRRIKKVVLTGKEEWKQSESRIGNMYSTLRNAVIPYFGFCDRAVNARNLNEFSSSGKMLVETSGGEKWLNMWLFDTDISVADFKTYLAAQYAAGTPVTVWYVLANPETGIVNEPLHKIGDYADTISMAQAGVTLPTAAGANTLTVGMTVQPSAISITGNIKPTGYGQLLDKNLTAINDSTGTPIFIHE